MGSVVSRRRIISAVTPLRTTRPSRQRAPRSTGSFHCTRARRDQPKLRLFCTYLGIMADSAVQDWKAKYVASVKDFFQCIEESKLHSGKIVSLDRLYPRLRAIQVNRGEYNQLPYSGSLLQEIEVSSSSNKYSPSTVQALYVPDNSGFVPKTVVVQGAAGIGKTLTTQKIMLDWASGKLYGDRFDFVFFLSCREINRITGDLNLHGLLAKSCNVQCSEDLLKSIFKDPSKILVIFDGFDELRWSLEDNYEEYQDPFQETHKEILLRSIFRKEMLNEMSLMITTRTLCLQNLKDYVESPCSVELLGFTGRDLEVYIFKFFKNKEATDKALSVIRGNEALLTMCSVPLVCWMVCTILKQGVETDALALCKTSTSVYLLYLRSLMKYDSQAVSSCIKKLCALASEGVMNQKILFEEEDLGRHGLALSDMESVFLNQNIFHRDTEPSICYSFGHLSVQEFFAALHYVLDKKDQNGEDPFHPEICKGGSLLGQSANHPHLTLTVRFLCGLLNEKALEAFARSVGFKATLRAKAAMEKWISSGKSSKVCCDALYCIFEMQDEAFRERVSHQASLEISPCVYFGATENVCTRELSYFLGNAKDFSSISMEDFLLRSEDLQTLSPSFHRSSKLSFVRCGFADDGEQGVSGSWLCRPNSNIQELELSVCVFTPSFFQHLRAFISSNGAVSRLRLAYYKMVDSALKVLCEGLRMPGCTVQELTFQDCDLSSSSCQELGAAITSNRTLRKLDLSMNKLQDDGVRFLCEGLRVPGCTLEELRIDHSDLTPGCCDYLLAVLLVNRSLTTLSMRGNDLQDCGVKRLCDGLRHPDCVLKELRLHESNLTSSCCEDFLSVLHTNRSLTTLDLTENNLQDAGIKRLCEGLCNPACTLQELILHHCDLTSASCQDLRSAITTNRSLTKLDLASNSLGDSAVKPLSEALNDPACVLRELSLYNCDLTSSSCEDLCSIITTNRSLITLDLSGNQFEDSGIKLLCAGLRDPGCKLQVVRIGYCDLTSTCCDEILTIINTNQSVVEMDVSMNADEEKPSVDVDALCKRLERPSCYVDKNETQDGTYVYFRYKKQN